MRPRRRPLTHEGLVVPRWGAERKGQGAREELGLWGCMRPADESTRAEVRAQVSAGYQCCLQCIAALTKDALSISPVG